MKETKGPYNALRKKKLRNKLKVNGSLKEICRRLEFIFQNITQSIDAFDTKQIRKY